MDGAPTISTGLWNILSFSYILLSLVNSSPILWCSGPKLWSHPWLHPNQVIHVSHPNHQQIWLAQPLKFILNLTSFTPTTATLFNPHHLTASWLLTPNVAAGWAIENLSQITSLHPKPSKCPHLTQSKGMAPKALCDLASSILLCVCVFVHAYIVLCF